MVTYDGPERRHRIRRVVARRASDRKPARRPWGDYVAYGLVVVAISFGFLSLQHTIDAINHDRAVRIEDRVAQDKTNAKIARDAFVFNCAKLDKAQTNARAAIVGGGHDLAGIVRTFFVPANAEQRATLARVTDSIEAAAAARAATLKPIDCSYPPKLAKP